MAPSTAPAPAPAPPPGPPVGRIDVHAHLWTPAYLDRLERLGRTDTGTQRGIGADAGPADLDHRFALMDRTGIAVQVLSVPPQSPHLPREADAVELARAVNESYAELVAHWPGRFRAFAALPLPHVDAALRELAYALDELGMVGAAVTTTVRGLTLADPRFRPLYEELDRRGAVLYVHPAGEGAGSPLITGHRMTWMVGAPVEDTVAVMHLILAGLPRRYPRMRILASHLGGALPMLLRRLDDHLAFESPETPELPSVAARRLWYDTVAHCHGPALVAAAASFGADRLVLGTDFPYEDGEVFVRAVSYVSESGLPPRDAAAILDTNAAALLGGP
ncbi:amidohydrolase family protein [Streptomyces sp. ZAF1911]|uniref:amidohydrolase family protein n=1 Tax=Streptomyces sp. ZAF1911 TaxID=2944129 RepID=UPI00237A5B36|nr:amidohydrolase family protein [Streptomyces sp. ZAF1911]MDD9375287.1 amidohydrolase family protein [Streptomyces sp. ZAF1911]